MKTFLKRVGAGAWALISRRRLEAELDAELRDYLGTAVEEKIATGMSRTEAVRAARAEIGSVEALKDHVRDQGWESVLESVWRDARYAVRTLRRSPGFATVTILTLALGIGANTAVFSVAHAVVLQSLPYPEPDRLVAVIPARKDHPSTPDPISYPTFRDWQSQSRSFESLAAYVVVGSTLTGRGEPDVPATSAVTSNFFSLLRAAPMLGRTFLPDDDNAASGRVVVISEQLWRERLGGSRDAIGQVLVLDGAGHTVVGIMPSSFRFPHVAPAPQLWMPLQQFQSFQPLLSVRMAPFLTAIGRLRSNAAIREAQAEMEPIVQRLGQQYPADYREQIVRVVNLQEQVLGDSRSSVLLLLAAVGLLLLIACTNVASLQLAKTIGRTREMVVRTALGAAKARLVRQILVESLMLALAGGALGLLVGDASLWMLSVPIGRELPQIREVGINRWVLAFTFVLSCVTGVLFGLLPMMGSSLTGSSERLRDSGRGAATPGRRNARTQNVLVVVEVALAFVMLMSAGLLVRSLMHLQRVDPGFTPERLLTATISLPQSEYKTAEHWQAFNEGLLGRVRQMPGIEAAAFGVSVPFLGTPVTLPFGIEGRPSEPDRPAATEVAFASPDYFKTMRIPVLQGREFADTDRRRSQRVGVVNRAFARRYFEDRDPLGQRIILGPPKGILVDIVGLVADTAQTSLVTAPPALLYLPYAQRPFWITSFVVRTTANSHDVATAFRRELLAMAPNVPVLAFEPMDALLGRSFAASRYRTQLLGLFGGLAVILTAIGIHGLLSYTVTKRTNEIGIRLALGAEPGRLRRSVMAQGFRLTLIGMALGLTLAVPSTRLLQTFLFGVNANDPLTFLGAVAFLLVVAMVACYVPARSATKIDPLAVLRCD